MPMNKHRYTSLENRIILALVVAILIAGAFFICFYVPPFSPSDGLSAPPW